MLFIIELFLYWVAIILVATKIYDGSIKRNVFLWCHIGCFIGLIVIHFSGNYDLLLSAVTYFQIIQLILIWRSLKNVRIVTVFGIYILIFSFNITLVFCAQCLIRLGTEPLRYVEFGLNIFTFLCCIALCYMQRSNSLLRRLVAILPKRAKVLSTLAFGANSVLMPLFFANPDLTDSSPWSTLTRALLFFLALFICTVFPIFLITTISNVHLKRQNESFEHNLQIQADHYAALAKSNFELRRFRHDFKNVKIGLSRYIEQQDIPSALALLESGEDTMRAAEDILPFDCGNGIIDALLADKQTKALDKNISIRFDGAIPSLSKLAPIDLCVIFGNTIDNAVEACEPLPAEQEKVIQISAQCSCGFLFIKIQNPTAAPVVIRNNMVATTKVDKTAHGFGLYSLEQTIKKYDGTIKLSYENYIFTLEITLPLC